MRLLLDTHILVWLIADATRLTRGEANLIYGSDATVLVSAITLWEVRLKRQAFGKRRASPMPISASEALVACRKLKLDVLTPAPEDFAAPLSPALSHHDPFDELLIVHARQLGTRLLTRDAMLIDHPIAYRP